MFPVGHRSALESHMTHRCNAFDWSTNFPPLLPRMFLLSFDYINYSPHPLVFSWLPPFATWHPPPLPPHSHHTLQTRLLQVPPSHLKLTSSPPTTQPRVSPPPHILPSQNNLSTTTTSFRRVRRMQTRVETTRMDRISLSVCLSGVICYIDVNTTDAGLVIQAVSGTLKRKKRDLRGIRPKVLSCPNAESSLDSSSPPNDQLSAGLDDTISNLVGKHGILQGQFFGAFSMCASCKRIICNETFRLDGHTCVIEIED